MGEFLRQYLGSVYLITTDSVYQASQWLSFKKKRNCWSSNATTAIISKLNLVQRHGETRENFSPTVISMDENEVEGEHIRFPFIFNRTYAFFKQFHQRAASTSFLLLLLLKLASIFPRERYTLHPFQRIVRMYKYIYIYNAIHHSPIFFFSRKLFYINSCLLSI